MPFLFEKLKKTSGSPNASAKQAEHFFFQIDFDEYGTFLSVADEKLNACQLDCQQYSGSQREPLKNLAQIQEKSGFVIDREKGNDNIYLRKYDYLIWQLKLCNNVVDAEGNAIDSPQRSSVKSSNRRK